MTRVVLDTNVVVSALLVPTGNEAAVFQLVLAKLLELYVSAPILEEYEAVLHRPKFKLDAATVHRLLARIRDEATLARPSQRTAVSPDESDNRFLECAEAAHAHFLITGNLRHFPKEWKGTRVVSAGQLLDLVA